MTCALVQIFTAKIPYSEFPQDKTVISKKLQGQTPAKPSQEMAPELTDSVWEIMMDCWNFNPSKRPTADEVIERLPPLPRGRQAQEDFWRPKTTWTTAEMTADKAFLVDFVRQASQRVSSWHKLITHSLTFAPEVTSKYPRRRP